jgi:AbrB family looped-hinge helix DNA binding protein
MKAPIGPKGKYAWTVKVGEKGQFVIPKEAREVFNISPGDTLLLLGDERKGLAIPPKGALIDLMSKMFNGGTAKEDGEE